MRYTDLVRVLLSGKFKKVDYIDRNGVSLRVSSIESKDNILLVRTEDSQLIPVTVGRINVSDNLIELEQMFSGPLIVEI